MPTLKLIGTPVFPSVVLPPGGTTVGTRRVFSEDLREENSNQVANFPARARSSASRDGGFATRGGR